MKPPTPEERDAHELRMNIARETGRQLFWLPYAALVLLLVALYFIGVR